MYTKQFVGWETAQEWRFHDDKGDNQIFVRYRAGYDTSYVIWGTADIKHAEYFITPDAAKKRFMELSDSITAKLIRMNLLAEC